MRIPSDTMPKKSFNETIKKYIERDGRNPNQLSKRSEELCQSYPLSSRTIWNWLKSITLKPQNWRSVLVLARTLRLDQEECNDLLRSANKETLATLYKSVDPNSTEHQILSYWYPDLSIPFSPFQAPPDPTIFVGRDDKIFTISNQLRATRNHRIIVLTGMAGVGKTTLATRIAHLTKSDFPDGCLWLNLEGSDALTALHMLGDALDYDVSHYHDLPSRSSKIRELLAQKRILLVLDNAENDEQLRPLLPAFQRGGAALITTRRRDLATADEASQIEILPFVINQESAYNLFRTILRDRIEPEDKECLHEIANLVGFLPLALSIIAYRIRYEPLWTPISTLKRLREDDVELRHLKRGDKNVGISFNFSYHQLTTRQQMLFSLLGLFSSSGFTVNSVVDISSISVAEVVDDIGVMFSLSLIQKSNEDRLQLHPLLRAYARSKSGSEQYRQPFIAYFAQFLLNHQDDHVQIGIESNNIKAALQYAYEDESYIELAQSAGAGYEYWTATGQYDVARCHLERAISCLYRFEPNDIATLAFLLHKVGRTANRQGDVERTQSAYDDAISLARKASDPRLVAPILNSIVVFQQQRGELAQARETYNKLIEIAHVLEDDKRISAALTNLGLIAVCEGDIIEAKALYTEGVEIARQLHDPYTLVTLYLNMSELALDQGAFNQARDYLEKGSASLSASDHPLLRSRICGYLGLVHSQVGSQYKAREQFHKALDLAIDVNHFQEITLQTANLGLVAFRLAEYEKAHSQFDIALSRARQSGFPEDMATILNLQGECYLKQSRNEDAKQSFSEARDVAKKANSQKYLAFSLLGLAKVAEYTNHIRLAHTLATQCHEIFARLNHIRAEEVEAWLKQGAIGNFNLTK